MCTIFRAHSRIACTWVDDKGGRRLSSDRFNRDSSEFTAISLIKENSKKNQYFEKKSQNKRYFTRLLFAGWNILKGKLKTTAEKKSAFAFI